MIIFDMASAVQKYERIFTSNVASAPPGDKSDKRIELSRTFSHVVACEKVSDSGDVLSPLSPALVRGLQE